MNVPGCYRRDVSPARGRVAAVLPVTRGLDPKAVATCASDVLAAGADEFLLAAAGPRAVEVCTAAGTDARVVEGPPGASRAQLVDLGAATTEAEWILLVSEPVQGASPDWSRRSR